MIIHSQTASQGQLLILVKSGKRLIKTSSEILSWGIKIKLNFTVFASGRHWMIALRAWKTYREDYITRATFWIGLVFEFYFFSFYRLYFAYLVVFPTTSLCVVCTFMYSVRLSALQYVQENSIITCKHKLLKMWPLFFVERLLKSESSSITDLIIYGK